MKLPASSNGNGKKKEEDRSQKSIEKDSLMT